MGQIIIRLTESELRGLIAEAVAGVLQQPKEPSTEAISKLIYLTTGIDLNESRIRRGITEDRKEDELPSPYSVQKDVENGKAKPGKSSNKEALKKAVELANSRVDDATKAKAKAKEEEVLKPGEVVPRKTLLKHIIIDYYDGMKPNEIAKKYKIPKKNIGKLIKYALRKFNGDDVFNVKATKNGGRAKLAKPSKTFRDSVMKIARKRVEDSIGKKKTNDILGTESGSRTGFESQLRKKGGDKTIPIGTGEEMNEVQPEPSFIETDDFKKPFEEILTKYLKGNTKLKEMLLDFCSGKQLVDIARTYGYKDPDGLSIKLSETIEFLRNSVGFKREVSDLLNGKYNEKKINSLGMAGYVTPKDAEMFTGIEKDYNDLINNAYMRVNGLNTKQDIKIPDNLGYTLWHFLRYMTQNLVFDYNKRKPADKKKIRTFLQNFYLSSAFYNKWKQRIDKESQNETDNQQPQDYKQL